MFISLSVCHSDDVKFLTAFQFLEIKWSWLACIALSVLKRYRHGFTSLHLYSFNHLLTPLKPPKSLMINFELGVFVYMVATNLIKSRG